MLPATVLDDDFAERGLMLVKLGLDDAGIDIERSELEQVSRVNHDAELFDVQLEAGQLLTLELSAVNGLGGDDLDNPRVSVVLPSELAVDDADVSLDEGGWQLLALNESDLWQLLLDLHAVMDYQ